MVSPNFGALGFGAAGALVWESLEVVTPAIRSCFSCFWPGSVEMAARVPSSKSGFNKTRDRIMP